MAMDEEEEEEEEESPQWRVLFDQDMLPEMINLIMELCDSTALGIIRLVNRAWNLRARKYMLNRLTVGLHPVEVSDTDAPRWFDKEEHVFRGAFATVTVGRDLLRIRNTTELWQIMPSYCTKTQTEVQTYEAIFDLHHDPQRRKASLTQWLEELLEIHCTWQFSFAEAIPDSFIGRARTKANWTVFQNTSFILNRGSSVMFAESDLISNQAFAKEAVRILIYIFLEHPSLLSKSDFLMKLFHARIQ